MHEARIPGGLHATGTASPSRTYARPSANRDGIEYLASRFQPFKVGFPINDSVSTCVSGIFHRTERFLPDLSFVRFSIAASASGTISIAKIFVTKI